MRETKAGSVFEPQPNGYEPKLGRVEPMNPITADELVKSIKFGVNIGNAMDATGAEGVMGLATEVSWGNPLITKEFMEALAARGLDIIRLPVSWEPHIDAEFNIDPMWLDRVQEVVEYALDSGLYVILDAHHEERLLLPAIAACDYDAAHTELSRIWEQVAERFSGFGERLIFNLMNEPRAYLLTTEWQGGTPEIRDLISRLNMELLAQVRGSGGNNDKRIVMVTPIQAAIWYAGHLDPSALASDPYIMVSIHAYEPYDFALNRDGTDKLPLNNNIKDVFAKIDQLFRSKGIAVIMDETGAMNKNGNYDERIKWATEFSSYARKSDVPVVLWDNGVTDVSKGESFGLIDRTSLEWIYPELVDIFTK